MILNPFLSLCCFLVIFIIHHHWGCLLWFIATNQRLSDYCVDFKDSGSYRTNLEALSTLKWNKWNTLSTFNLFWLLIFSLLRSEGFHMGTLCGCSLVWAGLHWLTVRAFTLMGADASCTDVHHLPSHVPFHTTQGETHAEARGEFSCAASESWPENILLPEHISLPHTEVIQCAVCCAVHAFAPHTAWCKKRRPWHNRGWLPAPPQESLKHWFPTWRTVRAEMRLDWTSSSACRFLLAGGQSAAGVRSLAPRSSVSGSLSRGAKVHEVQKGLQGQTGPFLTLVISLL